MLNLSLLSTNHWLFHILKSVFDDHVVCLYVLFKNYVMSRATSQKLLTELKWPFCL